VTTAGPTVITFDLFSALIDSRSGAGLTFAALAAERGWPVPGSTVYDAWDARNKENQRTCRTWVPYEVLAAGALGHVYVELGLRGEPETDLARILDSLPDWPLWPDVAGALPDLGSRYRIGLLSNVDDALFRRTRAAALVEPGLAMTSERLGAYKPDPAIYLRAKERLGPMVHIASSARDVRGSLESGIPVVRLARPGHHVDPEGPDPTLEAEGISELPALVAQAARTLGD
jgi:2-haloalkanoic acid dehalogenase type II